MCKQLPLSIAWLYSKYIRVDMIARLVRCVENTISAPLNDRAYDPTYSQKSDLLS
jgi:hypothetical protein